MFGLFLTDTWSVGKLSMNAGVRYDRYKGWLPEQDQMAGTAAGWAASFPALASQVQAKSFAQRDLYTWNSFAPRIGVVYDLSGTGRTVVKANYGLYWHNPGVGISGNANPNTANKSATYTWTDLNGDRRWQPGEQAAAFSLRRPRRHDRPRSEHQGSRTRMNSARGSSSSSATRWVCVPASSTRPRTT